MVLRIAKAHFGEKVPITFPTETSKVWNEMSGLEEFGTYGTIKYIIGEGISEHFAGHITLADLNTEPGIQKINQLAELVDAMDDTTQKVFIGVLAAEPPASLDGILHAASKVGQYELIAEVSTDRELGEWLVKHGHLGADISDTVRPYLDYPFIGAQYYKSHEGAYTPNGYVRLREPFPVLETAGPYTIQLTLTARSGEFPLDLPITEAQLDQVKEALGIEDFDQCGTKTVNVTVLIADTELSFKVPSGSLKGYQVSYSTTDIPTADRRLFYEAFGRGATYGAADITKITSGRKTIYEAPPVQTEDMVEGIRMGGISL